MPTPVRRLFNEMLAEYMKHCTGRVVDVGGGLFSHRRLFDDRAHYVNIDLMASPGVDVICNFMESIPFQDGVLDAAICTSVLEHVTNPKALVVEIHRILKPEGVLIGYTPFLFPVHPTPLDCWRFAPDGLKTVYEAFEVLEVRPVGGRWLLILHLLYTMRSKIAKRLCRSVLVPMLYPVVKRLDRTDESGRRWTSGYFVLARKDNARSASSQKTELDKHAN